MTVALRGRPSPIGWSEPPAFPIEEWDLLGTSRPNVLITGPGDRTANVLAALQPSLRAPVVTWSAGHPPCFPTAGTLVVINPAALSREEQLRLLSWLREGGAFAQVVTASTLPLWPLVCAGVFVEALHYYLNTVCLEV